MTVFALYPSIITVNYQQRKTFYFLPLHIYLIGQLEVKLHLMIIVTQTHQ